MAEKSPWSALNQLKFNGIIEWNQKPTREQMERMNQWLHDAQEEHFRKTGRILFREYFVPYHAKPVELADGTTMEYW